MIARVVGTRGKGGKTKVDGPAVGVTKVVSIVWCARVGKRAVEGSGISGVKPRNIPAGAKGPGSVSSSGSSGGVTGTEDKVREVRSVVSMSDVEAVATPDELEA
jgi:hypothetical protein